MKTLQFILLLIFSYSILLNIYYYTILGGTRTMRLSYNLVIDFLNDSLLIISNVFFIISFNYTYRSLQKIFKNGIVNTNEILKNILEIIYKNILKNILENVFRKELYEKLLLKVSKNILDNLLIIISMKILKKTLFEIFESKILKTLSEIYNLNTVKKTLLEIYNLNIVKKIILEILAWKIIKKTLFEICRSEILMTLLEIFKWEILKKILFVILKSKILKILSNIFSLNTLKNVAINFYMNILEWYYILNNKVNILVLKYPKKYFIEDNLLENDKDFVV
ncbi:hypothetical protein LUQ84_3613 [Hamiltosporidium tvaerminnensis]|nr:hypothetical protein LUQ84_3613 [Hamiltosporidium tvaerminnensis]